MRKAGLADAEKQFLEGDRFQILTAIILAAAGRESVPEWARAELWKIERGLNRGEIRDLNEAFGWTQKGELSKKSRTEASRYRRHRQDVFQALWEARRIGQGMTPVTFEEIAERFKVGRSLVQRVWIERKEELLRVKEGDPKGNHVVVVVSYWDE